MLYKCTASHAVEVGSCLLQAHVLVIGGAAVDMVAFMMDGLECLDCAGGAKLGADWLLDVLGASKGQDLEVQFGVDVDDEDEWCVLRAKLLPRMPLPKCWNRFSKEITGSKRA